MGEGSIVRRPLHQRARRGITSTPAFATPFPAALMRAYPIGPAVGNVRNDSPERLEPAQDEAMLPQGL